MKDSRLTIHESTFASRPCENYTCRQAANKRKFFVGNPHGHGQKPIYCEDCINYLFANAPTEFVIGGAGLEDKLRAEITAEYDQILQDRIFAAVQADRERANQEILDEAQRLEAEAQLQADPNYLVEEEKTEVAAEVEDEEEDPLYRCLDCGKEFASPQALGTHRRKHRDG